MSDANSGDPNPDCACSETHEEVQRFRSKTPGRHYLGGDGEACEDLP